MSKEELKQSIQTALAQGDQMTLENRSKEAVRTYPEEAFGYAYLAEALLMEPDPRISEAERCLAKASQLDPQNTTYLSQFAALKSAQGEEGAAQLLWGKILSMDPDHVDALTAKGRYQLRVNRDYQQAIELFDQAIQLDIDNAPSYLYRAEAYAGLEQYDRALRDFDHAIELQDGSADAQALLLHVDILQGLHRPEDAATTYDAIVALDPDNPIYHSNYAQLLVSLGRHEAAAAHYGRAVHLLGADDPLLSYAWGQALYQSGQYAPSIEAFEGYVRHAQDPELGLLMQVQAQLRLGQYATALETLQTARQKADNAMTQDRLQTLQGEALLGLERYDEAVEVLRPLASKTGLYQDDAAYVLGKVYAQQGEPAKAYPLVKAAFLHQHKAATAFLHGELADYVNQLQQRTLDVHHSAVAQNAQSSFVQSIQGKVWRFRDFQSQRLSNFGAEQAHAIKRSLSSITLLVTERGLLQLSPNKAELFTYKIGKETPKGILAILVALDQLAEFKAKLTAAGNGLLAYSKEKGEVLVLEARAPEALDDAIAAQLRTYLQRRELELLGPAAQPLIERVWK